MDNFDLKKFLIENKLTSNSTKAEPIQELFGFGKHDIKLYDVLGQSTVPMKFKVRDVKLGDNDIQVEGSVDYKHTNKDKVKVTGLDFVLKNITPEDFVSNKHGSFYDTNNTTLYLYREDGRFYKHPDGIDRRTQSDLRPIVAQYLKKKKK